MSGDNYKQYWKNPSERNGDAPNRLAEEDEFPETPRVASFSRRGFLKAAGFTAASGILTGCGHAPVEKAIPYLLKPEEITPGRAYFYASTCGGCSAGCGLLAKNRDGRPVKLEGNPGHPLSRGGLCAAGQASILGLYDSLRLQHPTREGKQVSWQEVDREIPAQLEAIRKEGRAVRFLTGKVTSPTARTLIGRFLSGFKDARHVVYDPLSSSAILDAHQRTHGARQLPHYRFERAEVIVSFDADFLGTWISPVEFAAGYRAGRTLEGSPPRLSYHVQFESRMSLTGSKADQRVCVAPGDLGVVMTQLAGLLAKTAGIPLAGSEDSPVATRLLDQLASRLWQARGRSLIVCGNQDVQTQVLCNFLNHVLENYGATVDLERPSLQRQGSDRELASLLQELHDGKIAALFIAGVNPVYDLPDGDALARALPRAPLVVSFAERLDETASLARYVCPEPHFLESWSDAEPVSGILSLTQPALHPLANTRSLLESLAAWMGTPKSSYEILQESWERDVFPRSSGESFFQAFWERAVHDGYAKVEPKRVAVKAFDLASVRPVPKAPHQADRAFTLVLYPKVGMLDGRHAHNAWLQELADPISKVTWDNYACLSPATAARLGLAEGDVVRLEAAPGKVVELPVFHQPGQHDDVIAAALGYGRKGTERFARIGPRWLEARPSVGEDGLVGRNTAPFLALVDGTLRYTCTDVRLTPAGRKHALASTQSHHSVAVPRALAPAGSEPRPIIQETIFPDFVKNPSAGRRQREEEHVDLWPQDHPYAGHRWGMVIDLNACTGCSACVIACQAENNIPVVGKDEVRRRREMHWLRIDRYYSGPDNQVDVAHQPMLCQQCDHAPCETVCPVLATVHSEEGLNLQIYNRCVGTRYCANNCPYKTRRFNWFDYPREDRLQNLVLNPDVTVRSRGVMEKCTFCVQRIQEAKIEAKRRGEALGDGTLLTACQQTCPAQAITFGDLNDPKSKAAHLLASPRHYHVLAELNVRPAVGYLRLVRNRQENEGGKNLG